MRSIVKVAAAAFCLISGESGAKLKLSRFLVVVVDGGIGGTGGTAPLWRPLCNARVFKRHVIAV